MNEILTIFLTWNFVLLCVGISTATFFFRKMIDFFILDNPKIPIDKHSRIWRELVLPFTPIFIGIAFGASRMGASYPYPDALSTWAGKFLFAASAGMLSPIVYRVITALLSNSIRLPTGAAVLPNVFEGDQVQTLPLAPAAPSLPPVSSLPVDSNLSVDVTGAVISPSSAPSTVIPVPPGSVIEMPPK